MLQGKITRISFAIALTILTLMWVVFFFDYYFDLKLYVYGLRPRSVEGLLGIFTSPFLHSTRDFAHILNNSAPVFILSWMLFYHYRKVAMPTFLFIYFFTGMLTWLLARDSYHIGMSGVIYGLTSFLVVSGFYRKHMRISAISLVVIFLYGSTVWGIFPTEPSISWEGHAFGFLSGISMAYYYRDAGPQPAKLMYELEEELGIEPEEEYWMPPKEQAVQAEHEPKVIIQYQYVKKEVEEENKEEGKEEKS